METVMTLSKRRKRRIRPPKPPSPLVTIFMVMALIEMARYWRDLGLLSVFGWYAIFAIAWGFRDWALQSTESTPYDYPMKGRPLWMRVIYVLCFPVTLVYESYLVLVWIKNMFWPK